MPVRAGRAQDRRLIQRKGRTCLWQQAVPDPRTRDGGQHDYTQSDETDRGYLYSAGTTIKAMFHGDNRDESFNMAGAWEKGRARMTFSAHLDIGDQDRITVQELFLRDSLALTRGSGTADIIRQTDVTELLLVRDAATEYTIGTDCKLSETTEGSWQVEWLTGGQAPTAEAGYSILMKCKPVWVVDGHSMLRGFSGKKRHQLPGVVDLKRDDVAVRGS